MRFRTGLRAVAVLSGFAVVLSACTTLDAYTREEETSHAQRQAVIGAAAGAAVGLITGDSSMERKKRALVGAGLGALAGAGVGELYGPPGGQAACRARAHRRQRHADGDNITLNMPGNITFATNSADLNANFYDVSEFREHGARRVRPDGHRGRGPYGQHREAISYNQQLSERRAALSGGLPWNAQRAARPHHHGRDGRSTAGRDERHGPGSPAESPRRADARTVDAGKLIRGENVEGRTVRTVRPSSFVRSTESEAVRPPRAAS